MEMRLCTTCKIEKELILFCRKKVNGVFTYKHICKKCHKLYMKQYREDNADQLKIDGKNHDDNRKEYKKLYYQDNKIHITEVHATYKVNNKNDIRKQNNIYKKNKRDNDPSFKLRDNVRRLINYLLNTNNVSKNKKSILNFLPYTIQELKEHLEKQFEPWMSWNNYGKYNKKQWNDGDVATWKWQIDHIMPQAYLNYTSMENENFQKCWALNNLRPLSAKQNCLDGVIKTRHKRER